MIGYLIDLIKNRKENPLDTDTDRIEQDVDSNEIEEFKGINHISEQAEVDETLKKETKIRKRNKKLKKKKKIKYRGPLFIIGFIFLIGFLISKLMLLYSHEEYILLARLSYNHSLKAYKITYQIEELNNPLNIKTGQTVCSPYYYTSTAIAVTESPDDCIKGIVISNNKNKVKIEYKNLPKYIDFDQLFLYLDKTKIGSNTIIGDVRVKLKYFNKKYLITNIYP